MFSLNEAASVHIDSWMDRKVQAMLINRHRSLFVFFTVDWARLTPSVMVNLLFLVCFLSPRRSIEKLYGLVGYAIGLPIPHALVEQARFESAMQANMNAIATLCAAISDLRFMHVHIFSYPVPSAATRKPNHEAAMGGLLQCYREALHAMHDAMEVAILTFSQCLHTFDQLAILFSEGSFRMQGWFGQAKVNELIVLYHSARDMVWDLESSKPNSISISATSLIC